MHFWSAATLWNIQTSEVVRYRSAFSPRVKSYYVRHIWNKLLENCRSAPAVLLNQDRPQPFTEAILALKCTVRPNCPAPNPAKQSWDVLEQSMGPHLTTYRITQWYHLHTLTGQNQGWATLATMDWSCLGMSHKSIIVFWWFRKRTTNVKWVLSKRVKSSRQQH